MSPHPLYCSMHLKKKKKCVSYDHDVLAMPVHTRIGRCHAPRLCLEFRARVFNCLDGNGGYGGGSKGIGVGKRLGWGSRKENLRKSPGTVKGFQKVSKTEPTWGVLDQKSLSPRDVGTHVSPWKWASVGWLS